MKVRMPAKLPLKLPTVKRLKLRATVFFSKLTTAKPLNFFDFVRPSKHFYLSFGLETCNFQP
jgi:hypothetical protein